MRSLTGDCKQVRVWLWLSAFLAVLVFLAACGDSGKTTSTTSQTTALIKSAADASGEAIAPGITRIDNGSTDGGLASISSTRAIGVS